MKKNTAAPLKWSLKPEVSVSRSEPSKTMSEPSSKALPRPRHDWRGARGSAIVESALILLFFFTLILAVLELGRFFSVHQTLTNAAREGARLAATPTAGTDALAGDAEIEAWVRQFLDSNGVSPANVSIERDVVLAGGDDVFTVVEITTPYQVLTASWFADLEVTMAGRARMRNETSP